MIVTCSNDQTVILSIYVDKNHEVQQKGHKEIRHKHSWQARSTCENGQVQPKLYVSNILFGGCDCQGVGY